MSLRQSALEWCAEDRTIAWRLPLYAYGVFVLGKLLLAPSLFTPLDFLNLGVHELGHVVAAPFGEWIGIAGGSAAQLLAPAYGVWQFLRQRDFFAAAFGFAWLGESLGNLSVYIADARRQELPLANLFGGDPIHDWNYLLAHANRLHLDQAYALKVRALGLVCAALFLWLGGWLLWEIRRARGTR